MSSARDFRNAVANDNNRANAEQEINTALSELHDIYSAAGDWEDWRLGRMEIRLNELQKWADKAIKALELAKTEVENLQMDIHQLEVAIDDMTSEKFELEEQLAQLRDGPTGLRGDPA